MLHDASPEIGSRDVGDAELLALFPGEPIDHDNAFYYRGLLDRQVLVQHCSACGHWQHPAGPVCASCWSPGPRPRRISGTGVVHLLMRLHQGPAVPGVDYSTPYPVATVELAEQPGLRLTTTLTGPRRDDVRIGDAVELDWIDRAGHPVPAFRPLEG